MTTLRLRLPALDRILSQPIGRLLHRGAWGFVDQALISAASFVTLILIARAVTPADFGLFSIALSFIYIETTLVAAILNQPFAVISASHQNGEYRPYVTTVLLAHTLCALTVALAILLVGAFASVLDLRSASLILMLALAVLAWQFQEFFRAVLYVEDRLPSAVFNDLVSYGSQLLLIIYATQSDLLSPEAALMIIAASSGFAAFLGLFAIRNSITPALTWRNFLANSAENWQFSRWTFGSSALTIFSSNTLPFVLAAFSGPAAAGVMRVMAATMGPTHILLRGMQASFGPVAARAYESEGAPGLHILVRRMFYLITPLMAGYCLIAAGFARPLLSLLYDETYTDYAWLLAVTALSYFIVFLYTPIEIALRALRSTSVLFRASVWNFLGVWIIGAPSVYVFGLEGVTILVSVNVIVGLELWRRYVRDTRTARLEAASGDVGKVAISTRRKLDRERGLSTEV
jgi:O-antigen/teichoic acid export membrane protein